MRIISVYCKRSDPEWMIFDVDLTRENIGPGARPDEMDCCGVFKIGEIEGDQISYIQDKEGQTFLACSTGSNPPDRPMMLGAQTLMSGDCEELPITCLWSLWPDERLGK